MPSTADPIDGRDGRRRGGGRRPRRSVALFCHGTTVATNALITRRLAARGDGHDAGLPRRDRDPPRHPRRPVGRLQGHRPALHPPPRPARGHASASTTAARCSQPLDEDEAREVAADPRKRARSRRSRSASSTPTPTRAHEQRMGEILRRSCPACSSPPRARCCRSSSSTSASRPRSPTPCWRRWSAATCGGSSERLKDGGYDGDLLLLHSGGGVMTPETAEQLPCGWPPRASPPAPSPPRTSPRCAASSNAIGARHGRHQHRHLARLRRRAADHQRVVRRVRPPDLLPHRSRCCTIGAGGGSLAWIDDGRLAAQRAAVGRAPIPARRATAAAASEPTNTDANLVLGRLGDRADRRRDDARPRRPPRRRSTSRSAEPLGLDASRRRRRDRRRSPTRTWPTRSG